MDATKIVFCPLSSFHDYQFDAMISALELAKIPVQIEFFMSAFGDAFNLFVPQEYFEQAAKITHGIETSEIVYDKLVSIAKYNAAKSKA